MMEWLAGIVHAYRPYIDVAHALSSIVNLFGWVIGGALLWTAWRRNAVRSVRVGPMHFEMQEAAVTATAAAARDWQAKSGEPAARHRAIDLGRIRETVQRAFVPDALQKLTGKSVLWVDDNPKNNELALRALKKLQLDVEQETSTEAGLDALHRRHFDLVISDVRRGDNLRAGYDLLAAIRAKDGKTPVLLFSSGDDPKYRAEAAAKGAQLSTNDMLELLDAVIKHLGK